MIEMHSHIFSNIRIVTTFCPSLGGSILPLNVGDSRQTGLTAALL